MDPTYTGLNRSTLQTLPSDEVIGKGQGETIHIEGLRLGGRVSRFTSQALFRDLHSIGSSTFDDKGSVLMANLDAVLNLTEHVGGYIANGTADDNASFYSLLLEDHTLEMYSYIQWRRPLSVSRVILAHVLVKPELKTAQLDTLLKTDIPAVVALKPCFGYQIIGLISHGGGDSLTGYQSVTLRDLVTVALLSLTVIHRTQGKAFIVFPFKSEQKVSGTMTGESILDFAVLCILMYRKVWCFRPYMCHNLVCIAFSEPREDPPEGSIDAERLLALWDALRLLPPLQKRTSPSTVDPEIAKVAELDMTVSPTASSAPPIPVGDPPADRVLLEGSRNFSRLFDGTNIGTTYPELTRKVHAVLTEQEDPQMIRDRVEVLSRWQIPDSPDLVVYPF